MYRRLTAIAATLALAFAAAVPAVAAETSGGSGTEGGSGSEGGTARLELVLDSSGSMAEEAGGSTRIDIAKESLNTMIDELPDEAQVGLRVYGATIDTGAGSCEDSQQVVEIGAGNRDAMRTAVAGYTPLGETPIAYSLQEAAKDLGDEGQRTIVLVSDGEPTCDPDPCVVAADLAAKGIDLKIDVVGLAVDAATRDKLKCIAENGNGTYYDADDAATLTQSLTQMATRAFRPFEVSGIPVEGGAEPAAATELDADQQYVDTVPTGEKPLYYSMKRTVPGSTLHLGATVRSLRGGQAFFDVAVETRDGKSCDRNDGMGSDHWGSRALITGSASTWKSDPEDECNTADELIFSVTQNGNELNGAQFEIVAHEEAPVDPDAELPPAETGVTWEPMESSAPSAGVTPGTSISNAPVLEPGSYEMEILTGETQVFAVPLDWGQHLQFQAVSTPRTGALDKALQDTATMNTRAIGPVREAANVLLDVAEEPKWADLGQSVGEGESLTAGGATAKVSYLNRSEGDVDSAALPGYRFVEVNFSGGQDSETFLLPYTLTVDVVGTAGDGAPAYVDDENLASPVPAPADMIVPASDETEESGDDAEGSSEDGADNGTDDEGADEKGGTDGKGGTEPTGDASTDDASPVAAESGTGFPVAPALLGLGGIVLLVGGGIAIAHAVRKP